MPQLEGSQAGRVYWWRISLFVPFKPSTDSTRPTHMGGGAICFSKFTDSNVNLIPRKDHRHTQRNVWPNIWTPHDPVISTPKINLHTACWKWGAKRLFCISTSLSLFSSRLACFLPMWLLKMWVFCERDSSQLCVAKDMPLPALITGTFGKSDFCGTVSIIYALFLVSPFVQLKGSTRYDFCPFRCLTKEPLRQTLEVLYTQG